MIKYGAINKYPVNALRAKTAAFVGPRLRYWRGCCHPTDGRQAVEQPNAHPERLLLQCIIPVSEHGLALLRIVAPP